jgi:Flp pilus assembly pilin Flp
LHQVSEKVPFPETFNQLGYFSRQIMFKQRNANLFANVIGKEKSKVSGRCLLLQRGTTSIEYALVASLITIAAVAGIGRAGFSLTNLWTYIETTVSAVIGAAIG